MLYHLKGIISSKLLSATSHHTVSQASVFVALGLALFVALLTGIFAYAQWRMAGELVLLQDKRAAETAERLSAAADMATFQANAHRGTLNVLLSRDSRELEEAENLRRSNLQDYSEVSSVMEHNPHLQDAARNLRVLTGQYEELSDQVVGLFLEARKEDALDLRVARLRESFNHWQEAHETFMKQLGQFDQRQHDDYEMATASAKKWLLGLLLAPLLLVVSGVLVIAALLGLQRMGPATTDTWTR